MPHASAMSRSIFVLINHLRKILVGEQKYRSSPGYDPIVRIRLEYRIAAATLTLGLLASACGDGATTVESADSAAALYGTTEQLASGDGQFDFGSLEGQEAVLWFWAPW